MRLGTAAKLPRLALPPKSPSLIYIYRYSYQTNNTHAYTPLDWQVFLTSYIGRFWVFAILAKLQAWVGCQAPAKLTFLRYYVKRKNMG